MCIHMYIDAKSIKGARLSEEEEKQEYDPISPIEHRCGVQGTTSERTHGIQIITKLFSIKTIYTVYRHQKGPRRRTKRFFALMNLICDISFYVFDWFRINWPTISVT